MVEAELALLEMEQERVWMQSTIPRQACLGITPEALDAVDVVAGMSCVGELVGVVVHAQMPGVAEIDQAVVATPAIAVDDCVEAHFPSDCLTKRRFRVVGHQLGVDLAAPTTRV